jgi:hypothetical protein
LFEGERNARSPSSCPAERSEVGSEKPDRDERKARREARDDLKISE